MSPYESRTILSLIGRVWQGNNVAITQQPLPRALADLVQRLEDKEQNFRQDFEPPINSLSRER